MLHKWNRFLSFLLAIALVTTTFGSDFATAKAYAVEGIETDLSSEGDGMADLSFAEEVTQSNEESAQEVTEVTEPTEPTQEVVDLQLPKSLSRKLQKRRLLRKRKLLKKRLQTRLR